MCQRETQAVAAFAKSEQESGHTDTQTHTRRDTEKTIGHNSKHPSADATSHALDSLLRNEDDEGHEDVILCILKCGTHLLQRAPLVFVQTSLQLFFPEWEGRACSASQAAVGVERARRKGIGDVEMSSFWAFCCTRTWCAERRFVSNTTSVLQTFVKVEPRCRRICPPESA